MHRFWIVAGALNMLACLIFAAATGHASNGEFVPVARQVLDTAREMHFVHSLALIAIGILSVQFPPSRWLDWAGIAFLVGIFCFSGGIYAAFGPLNLAVKILIPIGGTALMAGWCLFAFAGVKLKLN